MRIVNDLQELEQDLDLRRLHQIVVRACVAGNAALLQRRLIDPGNHAGRTHQDHDVRRLCRAQRAVFRDRSLVQEPLDARGDKFRLRARLVAAFLVRRKIIQAVQLDLRAGRVRKLRAGDERLVLRVIQPSGLLFHHERKNVVDRLQNLGPRAEILRQQQLARLAGSLRAEQGIGVVFGKEDRRIRQPEPVDRLLHVADHEQILPAAADSLKNALLHGVGVLIFVDQDLTVALRKASGGLRRLAGALFRQKIEHAVLQIGKIEQMTAALLLREALVKAPQQRQKPPQRRDGFAQILHDLLRRRVKIALDGLEPLLCLVAQRLDLLRVFRALRHSHAAEERNTGLHAAVPGRFGQKRPDKFAVLLQQGHAFFLHCRVSPAERLCLREHDVGPFERTCARPDIIRAPDRLLGRDALRQRIRAQAVRHPRFGIDLAAHHVVAGLGELQQIPVVAPVAERVDHGGKVRLVVELRIELGKHVAQHLRAQRSRLLLVRYAEIGGQLRLRRVLPQDGLTEAVYRGDLREIDVRELPLQMPVVRRGGQRVRDARGDLAAQLGRGCSGIGNNEEVVKIGGICGIGQIAHQPVDQNLRFSGARRRRNEQRAAPVLCRSPLLRRCADISHAPASFQAPPRIPST